MVPHPLTLLSPPPPTSTTIVTMDIVGKETLSCWWPDAKLFSLPTKLLIVPHPVLFPLRKARDCCARCSLAQRKRDRRLWHPNCWVSNPFHYLPKEHNVLQLERDTLTWSQIRLASSCWNWLLGRGILCSFSAALPTPHIIGSELELHIHKTLLSLSVKDFSLRCLKYLLKI